MMINSLYSFLFAQTDWTDIGPPSAVTLGVYCHPTEANIIYLIADTGHLFRSMDKGNSWQRISQRVAIATMPQRQYRGGEHAVAVDPRPGFGNIVYFSPGQSGAGLWKSTDYGTTWSKTQGSDLLGASVVAVDYNGTVICITGSRKIYSSPDGGDAWTDYQVPFFLYSKWYKPVSYKADCDISSSPVDSSLWIYGDGAHGLWMYGNPYFDARDPNVFHVAMVDFGHAYTT